MRCTLLAALLFSALPASATLAFTLTPAVQTGQPGSSITFSGTLQNNGLADLFLNDLTIAFTPPAGTYLTEDHNFFFANVPGVLLSGESYIGPIFQLLVAPGTPPGTYMAVVTLQGGSDPFALDPLAISGLTVLVAPEPGTLAFMLTGLSVLILAQRNV